MVAEGGEGENPLPFSLTAPKRGGGGWGGGGGGRGGYPGFVSLQVPTSEAAVSADTHAFARLPPGGLRKNRNLQSADLGGRWMVSEGGAVQFHERRGSRLRSSISAAGPGPKCIPVKNSKKCPGAHRLMKSLACCTD